MPRALWWILFCASALAGEPPVDYYVSLADAAEHIVHVRMHLAGIASQREVQLPAWNALYQILDFSQNLRRLHASDETGHRLPVESLNKNTWWMPQWRSAIFGKVVLRWREAPIG